MSRLDPLTSLESLENRYRFQATAVTETGLRVGAGKALDLASTDLPVLVDARGLPYLPGSSLKGVLRAALAGSIASLEAWASEDEASEDRALTACDPFDDPCCGQRRRRTSVDLADVLAKSCTVCGLFGSVHLAGRVFVHDAPLVGSLVDRPGLAREVRDGVGLDRDLGTAAPGVKYDVEVVPAGARFALGVTVENVDSVRLALVLDVLHRLGRGEILVGGSTRRGLGRLRLIDARLEHWSAAALRAGAEPERSDPDTAREEGLADLVTRLESTREIA